MREVVTNFFETGSCRHLEAMSRIGGAWRVIDFPSIVALIHHPEVGPILFDAGYDPAFLTATQAFPERLYRWATPVEIPPRRDAASRCRAAGIDPDDVGHIILSHFHGDHVAGLHRFRHAKLHCARAGLDDLRRGSRLSTTRRGLLPELLPQDFDRRACFFENGRRVGLPAECRPFEEGVDLLGDGALLAIELPGHCPGHWGLLINDSRCGLHFLIADAAWSCEAVRRNAPPPALTTHLLGDTAKTRATLDKLHRLHRRNPELRLTPCHCAERAAEIVTRA